MTTRTTYVPLHSIIVTRDDKQIDAHAEYLRTGKAFKFTAQEIDDIKSVNDGNIETSLRAPTDEAAPDEPVVEVAQTPATSNDPVPGTAPEEKKPATKKGAASKDDDL